MGEPFSSSMKRQYEDGVLRLNWASTVKKHGSSNYPSTYIHIPSHIAKVLKLENNLLLIANYDGKNTISLTWIEKQ